MQAAAKIQKDMSGLIYFYLKFLFLFNNVIHKSKNFRSILKRNTMGKTESHKNILIKRAASFN
jgi:hypothetical protein